jgi:hypothetical protein
MNEKLICYDEVSWFKKVSFPVSCFFGMFSTIF